MRIEKAFREVMMQEITVREALRSAIAHEMRTNSDIFIIGEEVAEYNGAYKVTQGLLQEFGSARVIDSPISEHGFAGLAVGAAFAGLRPIVEFMTFNFAMQAIDQIINSAAKTSYMSGGSIKCPIVFRGPNGAAAGVAAQHSQNFAAWYAHIPGLKVVAPYSAADAYGLLVSSIRDPDPVIFLENEILYGYKFSVPQVLEPVEFGKAAVLRSGRDITLVSFSLQVKLALEAAEVLASFNIEAEVIDLRSLRPLDANSIIASVQKTGRIVIIEEGWLYCGIGTLISALAIRDAFDYLDAPPEIVSGEDVPLPYAENLEKAAMPSVEKIVNAARKACYRKGSEGLSS